MTHQATHLLPITSSLMIFFFQIFSSQKRPWCSSEALCLLSPRWSLYTEHENGPKQHLDSDLAVNEPPLAAEDLSLL